MNFSVEQSDLQKALESLLPIVPARISSTVTSTCLLLEVGEDLSITATNEKVGLRKKVPAQITEPGSICVSGRYLGEVIEISPREEIAFSLNGKLFLRGKTWDAHLSTVEPKDFPTPSFREGKQWIVTGLGEALKEVAHAAGDEQRQESLASIILDFQDDLRVVAADGSRMAIRRLPYQGPMGSFLLPSHSAHLLEKMEGEVGLELENNTLFLSGEGFQMICPLSQNKMIPYDRFLFSGKEVEVDRNDLMVAVKSLSFAPAIVLSWKDEELTLESVSKEAEAKTVVEARHEGEGKIKVNTTFLREALPSLPERIVLKWNGEMSPLSLNRKEIIWPLL